MKRSTVKAQEARDAAKQQATRARDAAIQEIGAMSLATKGTQQNVALLVPRIEPELARKIQSDWDHSDDLALAVFAAQDELFDPNKLRGSADDFRAVAQQWESVCTKAQEATAVGAEITTLCNDLRKELDGIPWRYQFLTQKLDSVRRQYQSIISDGFRLSADDDLAAAQTALDTVRTFLDQDKPGLAVEHLDRVSEQCYATAAHINGLRVCYRLLTSRHEALSQAATAEAAAIPKTHEHFTELSTHVRLRFSWSSYDLEGKLEHAVQTLSAAATSMSMEQQQWDRATDQLDAAAEDLRSIKEARDFIHNHEGILEETTLGDKIDDLLRLTVPLSVDQTYLTRTVACDRQIKELYKLREAGRYLDFARLRSQILTEITAIRQELTDSLK